MGINGDQCGVRELVGSVASPCISYSHVFPAPIPDLRRAELALGRPAACVTHVSYLQCECAHCDSNANGRRKNT